MITIEKSSHDSVLATKKFFSLVITNISNLSKKDQTLKSFFCDEIKPINMLVQKSKSTSSEQQKLKQDSPQHGDQSFANIWV